MSIGGFVEFSLFPKRAAEQQPTDFILWRNRQMTTEGVGCFLELSFLQWNPTEISPGNGMLRIDIHLLLICR